MNAGEEDEQVRSGQADRDIVALGIATAAILMFVGTGSMVLPQIARSWMGIGAGPDKFLVNALLINIALIVFGWRRYRELTAEISERREAEERARQLAETDPLTGCLNRRSIAAATDRLIDAAGGIGRAVAYVMVDLDNFKLVNDLHSHKVGDAVLLATARRLSAMLPNDGLLARLGGDEFACVVPFDRGSPDRIDRFVARLIESVAQPIECEGLTAETTISIGIAASNLAGDGDAGDAVELMHQADIAMYHAKKQGKNRYFWFETPMESELRFRNDLETGIRQGIDNGEFVPFYEQQVDLETGELVGFEMLARWKSPRLGLVSPEVFIPVAEEIGVIAELSETLVEQALEDAKSWAPELSVSINISPVQMRDSWFSQKLLKLLVKHSFPPQRLDVEITESCLHDNISAVRSMITSLRNQGVTVSLDDFGTGFSSLSQLRSLPFDRIKIDRSFVSELKGADASSKIVTAIISLADGLNLPITAEGIDDEQALATLRKLGRLNGQGYYFGRPEDAAGVRLRLAKAGLLSGGETPVVGEPTRTDDEGRRQAAG